MNIYCPLQLRNLSGKSSVHPQRDYERAKTSSPKQDGYKCSHDQGEGASVVKLKGPDRY